jgi:hypothetical protein
VEWATLLTKISGAHVVSDMIEHGCMSVGNVSSKIVAANFSSDFGVFFMARMHDDLRALSGKSAGVPRPML